MVSRGGVPICGRLGNPYPTTGFGSLVFSENPTLNGPVFDNASVSVDAIGPLPPTSPYPGQLWFYTDDSAGGGTLYVFYDDGNTQQWVPASPNLSSIGPAGGDLVGSYPNPTLKPEAVANAFTVPTLVALKALTSRQAFVVTQGYNAPNDGGGGPPWQWVPGSAATTDDFMVVSPTGTPTGRYIRQLQAGANVSPKWAAWLGAADIRTVPKVINYGAAIDASGGLISSIF